MNKLSTYIIVLSHFICCGKVKTIKSSLPLDHTHNKYYNYYYENKSRNIKLELTKNKKLLTTKEYKL